MVCLHNHFAVGKRFDVGWTTTSYRRLKPAEDSDGAALHPYCAFEGLFCNDAPILDLSLMTATDATFSRPT
ncbi:hypothetical protein CHELA1G11_20849 [Hyphomicrobiales bacterium]|nr:hypothetical protein CHELA1G11_20849 [Hyphomicrobiales bacterium]CAH1692251.1 hypothetical protein CHELA1G2_21166 [Hyphomicrobiales bacterium]